MKHVWSPWRMEFIKKAAHGHRCIFCDYVRKAARANDPRNLVIYRGCRCFVLMNRYPYTNGHMMIAPYSHIGEIHKLGEKINLEMMDLTGASVRILKKILKCDGANCGINLGRVAGAGIAGHVHMHVVPRWHGDANFFPVIADTRSMPEYLEATYKKLKPEFDRMID